jgi:hypothetical protein
LGDLNPSLFLSPSKPGELIWGVGPAFLLPTGTSRSLGTGKWSLGPTAVALTIQGSWLIGVLANNLWSVAGPWDRTRVDQMLAQPFINYNLWALSDLQSHHYRELGRQARSTMDCAARRRHRQGLQVRRPSVQHQLQAFYNVERRDDGPKWQLRAQLTFLFPERERRAAAQD